MRHDANVTHEVLSSPRLTLRRFHPSDGAALHRCLGDPEVVRYEPYRPMTLEECQAEAARRCTDVAFRAVVLDGPDPVLIGNLWLSLDRPDLRTWQLGYVLSRDWWGRGLATEACRTALDDVFGRGAHRVEARCNPENAASWRLLERLGMRREAHHLRAGSFWRDAAGEPIWHDTFVYAVLDDEWSARRPDRRAAAEG